MAYVKLDDQIAHHPKVLRAGAEAAWLWACAIAYCNRQLTDGHVPAAALATMGAFRTPPRKLAATLVAVGLFDLEGDDYRVHDYLSHNPDKATVHQRMRDAAQRTAASRERRVHAPVTPMSQRDIDTTPALRERTPRGRATRTDSDSITITKPIERDDDSEIEGRPALRVVEAEASSSNHGIGPELLAAQELVQAWNAIRTTANGVVWANLGAKAKREIVQALRTKSLDAWEATFRATEASDYLAGRGDMPGASLWKAIELAERIDSGQYANKTPKDRVAAIQPLEDFIPSKFKTGAAS